MFRVSQVEESAGTIFTVDGQLSGDAVEAIETCCERVLAAGRAVELVLRDVGAVDRAGRALLCRLAARGVRLCARGVYTSYLVKALTHALPADKPGEEMP